MPGIIPEDFQDVRGTILYKVCPNPPPKGMEIPIINPLVLDTTAQFSISIVLAHSRSSQLTIIEFTSAIIPQNISNPLVKPQQFINSSSPVRSHVILQHKLCFRLHLRLLPSKQL